MRVPWGTPSAHARALGPVSAHARALGPVLAAHPCALLQKRTRIDLLACTPHLVDGAALVCGGHDPAHHRARRQRVDGKHVVLDGLGLHLVHPVLLLGDTHSLARVGPSLDGRRAEEDLVLGHANVVEQAGANRVNLVHLHAMPLQPTRQHQGIACRLQAMQGNVATLAVMWDALRLLEALGGDDVASKLRDVFQYCVIHRRSLSATQAPYRSGKATGAARPDAG